MDINSDSTKIKPLQFCVYKLYWQWHFFIFFLLQYSIWRKYISSGVLTCPVLSWIYRATDVCHQRSHSLAPLVESVLCQYSCAIKWTINRSLRFVPIFSAFIVPFICLFKKPLAEGTSSFTAKSKNFLQLRWDSQPCLYLGHHPVELFQHSQVPCKNTQSNNVTDPPPPSPSNTNQTCRLYGDTSLRLAERLLSGLCNSGASGASGAISEASARLMASWRCWTCRETPDTALEAQRGLLILRQMRSQLLLGRRTITISFSRKTLACVNVIFFLFCINSSWTKCPCS